MMFSRNFFIDIKMVHFKRVCVVETIEAMVTTGLMIFFWGDLIAPRIAIVTGKQIGRAHV